MAYRVDGAVLVGTYPKVQGALQAREVPVRLPKAYICPQAGQKSLQRFCGSMENFGLWGKPERSRLASRPLIHRL